MLSSLGCFLFEETVDRGGRSHELGVGVTGLLVGGEDRTVGVGIEVAQDGGGALAECGTGFGADEVGQDEEAVTLVSGDLVGGENLSHG